MRQVPQNFVSTANFKNCLAFWRAGWKVKEYLPTQTQAIIVRLEKNQEVQDFTFNLTEQKLWLKVMEAEKGTK